MTPRWLVQPVISCPWLSNKIIGFLSFVAGFWLWLLKVTAYRPLISRLATLPCIFSDPLWTVHLMDFVSGCWNLSKVFVCTLAWRCPWFDFCNNSPRLNHNIDYLPSQWQFFNTVVMHQLDVSHVISLHIWHQSHQPLIKKSMYLCHASIDQVLFHRGSLCALQVSMWVIFFNKSRLWKSVHSL